MSHLNDNTSKKSVDSKESARFGLGLQRWALLVVAFVLGVVGVRTLDRIVTVLDHAPSAAIAASSEKK